MEQFFHTCSSKQTFMCFEKIWQSMKANTKWSTVAYTAFDRTWMQCTKSVRSGLFAFFLLILIL